MAAIEAVTPLLIAGGHECILDLTAFRSPNIVPIKAFYGDDLKVNYFGKLATDGVPAVRAAFLDMVGTLMRTLDERNEHEARLLPYLLSALSDEAASIQEAAMGARRFHTHLHSSLVCLLWRRQRETTPSCQKSTSRCPSAHLFRQTCSTSSGSSTKRRTRRT